MAAKDKKVLLLDVPNVEAPKVEEMKWVGAAQSDIKERLPFACPGIRELAETYTLAVTEKALDAAATATAGKVWEEVDVITVFARMSPQGKARIIRSVQDHRNGHVVMVGDGGNDVGALKQADVGLALLSGYGDVNTSESIQTSKDGDDAKAKGSEEALNHQKKVLAAKATSAAKKTQCSH